MSFATPPPGFIVAGTASGVGKTTMALGLMRALVRHGHVVQPFKCGPDYIDPAFHTVAAGRPAHNLDLWGMRRAFLEKLVQDASVGASVIVAEGVMGLFDGAGGCPGEGTGSSTADLAALTGWPVVLVIDVSAQAETAAAVALGCVHYRADVEIAGVILNRAAGTGHVGMIAPAFANAGLPLLGALATQDEIALPERHLGLVQAADTSDLDDRLDRIAEAVAHAVDLDVLLAKAKPARLAHGRSAPSGPHPPGQRIALASDACFAFVYPHIVGAWRDAGAEVIPFSPLADQPPDEGADAIWLPGGYPELHGATLAEASRFRKGMATAAGRGVAIHGECGGYMVLGAGLEDAEGKRHAMTGLLSIETSFAKRAFTLGYRRARALAPSALGPAGTEFTGHEFHLASLSSSDDDPLLTATDVRGETVPERGARRGSVTGTFIHVIDGAG